MTDEKRFMRPIYWLVGLMLAGFLAMGADLAKAQTVGKISLPNVQSSGQSSLTIAAPLYTDALVLVANTAQSQAVPTGAVFAIFSAGCNFFVQRSGVATVPGASTTNGSAAQQNPAGWYLNNGETSFSVISASGCIVTISFYSQ